MTDQTSFPPLFQLALEDVAPLMGGTVRTSWQGQPFGTVSTDTRTIGPGQFFLALRGENFDGHQFCAKAAEQGCAGLIVEESFPDAARYERTMPVIRVDNTLEAYGRLARYRRMRWAGPLLAISGSVGKTTTRRLVASALARKLEVLEPEKNYNNLIGVPQTLLQLTAAHEQAVLELGMNQPGELAQLTQIAMPTAALLTRISEVHIGMFENFEALVSAKLDLPRSCPAGTPLALNLGCPHLQAAMAEFDTMHPVVTYQAGDIPVGGGGRDVTVNNITPLAPLGYRFDLHVRGASWEGLELRIFGRHQLENVAAAAAALVITGDSPQLLVDALPDFASEPLRGQWIEAGGKTLILDCYNAPAIGMISALKTLAESPTSGRRIVVLADMLELGSHSRRLHRDLLVPLLELAPAKFLGLGPECNWLAEALRGEGREAEGFEDRKQLTAALKEILEPDDQVFFKGSHSFGLEAVADAAIPEAGIAAMLGKEKGK